MTANNTTVKFAMAIMCLMLSIALAHAEKLRSEVDIHTWQWQYGSENCEIAGDSAIEVVSVGPTSFILRQNKCSHFEAPFMYLLVGGEKAVLFDTGAIADANQFPIYQTVQTIIARLATTKNVRIEEVIVMHSHHHNDHYAGDAQFKGRDKYTLVGPDRESLAMQFGLSVSSTDEEVELDLGGRQLKLITIPGHQQDSIALYDSQTQWLLTGDSLYPGSIRIEDWLEYKKSIARLANFTQQNSVSAILGGHIEMRADKAKIYRIGTTFQPNERPLALRVDDLLNLNSSLEEADKPKTLKFDKFIISPLNFFERQLKKLLSKNIEPIRPIEFALLEEQTEYRPSCDLLVNNSLADERSNPFICHQLQQQGVINTPVNDV